MNSSKGLALATVLAMAAVACLLATAGCSNDPYPPTEGKKILYGYLSEDPPTLDPVQTGDTLSASIVEEVYETLYAYDYLLRPYKLIPCLAESMPEVSEDGLTYTIRLKAGVRFQDDPCFPDGKGREMVAEDVVYSLKRLADIGTGTRGWWMLQGKVVGLDEFHDESVERVAGGQPTDYSEDVAGLQALDRYTVRIRLKELYPQLKYVLAHNYSSVVPHEAVDHYKKDIVSHPVGTGPFRLKEWSRRWRIILEKNPTYRPDFYPTEGEPGDREAGLLDAAGQRVPFVDEVFFTIMYESQPAWLYFLEGYRESSGIGKDVFQEAIGPGGELSDELRERGVRLLKSPVASVYYVGFNMKDELVGTNKKLRQAMSLAFDTDWRIKHFSNGRAISAQGPIPPGIFGYDPDLKDPYKEYNVEKARTLLAEAGYPDGIGPDGKRLEVSFDLGDAGPEAVEYAKAFGAEMATIGIKANIVLNTWSEFLRKGREGRLQVFSNGWLMDYPDPENFLQLLYGPNKAPGPNDANYDNPEYNRLFDQMKAMDDTPERLAIIRQMVAIVDEDAPWIPGTYPVAWSLLQPWYKNVKPSDLPGGFLKYRDVDVAERARLRAEWNQPNYMPLVVFFGILLGLSLVFVMIRRQA